MTTPLEPVGYSTTVECFGDSLTAGTGGTALATLLRNMLPGRLFNNRGIGGQKAAQIAARQGGSPITVTLTGNAFNGVTAVTLTAINNQFLSTSADNNTRYMSGSINGQQCAIGRTATGGPPSTTETYTILPAYNTTASVAAGSTFIPDDGQNAKRSVQVLWMGRNDVGASTITDVPGLVDACVANIAEPRRAIIIGVLAGSTETTGSGTTRTALDAVNATLAATYGDAYVSPAPPTNAEMTAVGYTPTSGDNTQIANGVWPDGLRSDSSGNRVHLTTTGYQIFANRVAAVLAAKGW